MMNFSEVDRFAAQLLKSASVDVESEWQRAWAPKLTEEIRRRAPSGRLRANIRQRPDGAEFNESAWWWYFVEYGTVDQGPRPFVNPALNHIARPAAVDAARRVIGRL